MLVLGIEGSANKIGVGIVSDEGVILSNPRHTYAAIIVSLSSETNLRYCMLVAGLDLLYVIQTKNRSLQ